MAANDRFNDEYLNSLKANDRYSLLPDSMALSRFSQELLRTYDKIRDENISNEKKIQLLREHERKLQENFSKLDYSKRQELLKRERQNIKDKKEELESLKKAYEVAKDVDAGLAATINKSITSLTDALDNAHKTSDELVKERKGVKRGSAQYKELTAAIKAARKEESSEALKETLEGTWDKMKEKVGVKSTDASAGKQITEALVNGLGKIGEQVKQYLTQAETILNDYNAKISARLEGSGRDYRELSKSIRQNLGTSTIVRQTKVLENLSRLVDSGIAYNLEQRAFLASVKDNIAQTFDVFDGNLMQIIRLQREDSSIARMGMERSLQEFFNENFLDTSYLTDMRKSISGALVEVESTMTNTAAAQFEYVVQKWLGSLYSMGASSSFISQLASGLNMLGTGNVQGLSGSPLQTLFALAANRSDTSYATLLSGGLTAKNTNELLKSMVEYLAEIAESNKTNRIVSGAYNSIFGMSQADLRALRNVSGDITTIYGSTLNYNEMQGSALGGIMNIAARLTLGEQVKNLFENLKYSSAANLVENPITYMTLLATNAIDDLTGGINIEAAPFGLGISAKMTDIIRGGLFGISFLSEVLGNFDKLGNPNNLGWITNTNVGPMRGTGYSLTARQGTSGSITAGGSGADITQQNLKNAAEQQSQVKEGISGENSDQVTVDDIFYALVNDKGSKGNLTAIAQSSKTLQEIMSASHVRELGAQRVVITGFNVDSGTGSFEMPIKFGATGAQQVVTASNITANGIKGNDGITLSQILELLLALTSNGDAINTNLKYSDVTMPELVAGTAGSTSSEISSYNTSPMVQLAKTPTR